MTDTAAFHTKFEEYIDEHFKGINIYRHKSGVDLVLQEKIVAVLDSAVISRLLYKTDPVEYEKLFEEWLLEHLTIKGAV